MNSRPGQGTGQYCRTPWAPLIGVTGLPSQNPNKIPNFKFSIQNSCHMVPKTQNIPNQKLLELKIPSLKTKQQFPNFVYRCVRTNLEQIFQELGAQLCPVAEILH